MYSIVIKDEKGDVRIHSIGENPKVFQTEEEAIDEVKELLDYEFKLFGEIVTRYSIVPYTEGEI